MTSVASGKQDKTKLLGMCSVFQEQDEPDIDLFYGLSHTNIPKKGSTPLGITSSNQLSMKNVRYKQLKVLLVVVQSAYSLKTN